jgi:hypothetical protein
MLHLLASSILGVQGDSSDGSMPTDLDQKSVIGFALHGCNSRLV